jgi:two-component system sensor histidine kinase DctS
VNPLDIPPGQAHRPQWAPAPGRRRTWWAVPFLLSLLFVGAVAGWLQWSDLQEQEDQRLTLIADALTLEAQLSTRIETEQRLLDTLARTLQAAPPGGALRPSPQTLLAEGLQHEWLSLTWLDANNRIVAHVPEHTPRPASPGPGGGVDEGGLSAHVWAPLRWPDGTTEGAEVARYSPLLLLRQGVPWWLARKYDVRLLDNFDQVIASTSDRPPPPERASYRVQVGPGLPGTLLELSARDRLKPWWTTLPLALMGVFVLLVGGATALLRRQVREVTRAEAAWQTEAAWRRAMEDSLTVGLRARDLDGRLTYVNRAFCDLVAFSADELLDRLPPMPYWPPDAIEDSMSRHLRNLAGGAPREGYEARWLRRDGQPIDVIILEAPLVDARGRQIGWMGSVVDITERKRFEERERRLSETRSQQARLTMLGEVASALAHQLNQPLTAITGYNAGVQRSLQRAGFADARVMDAVARLGEQAAEAGRIVKRIREFLTRRTPQRERCDLAAIAQRAVGLVQGDLTRQRIELDWALAPDLPPVLADPVLIEQVVINLVRNAGDALQTGPAQDAPARGGLREAGGLGALRIRLTTVLAEDGSVRLCIDDSGPGLQGRPIEALCEPFFSTKPDGMGMGLAICRSVIEAHHGRFEAAANAWGGARLCFTLPRDVG